MIFDEEKKLQMVQLEKKYCQGYKAHPIGDNEFSDWENEQVWAERDFAGTNSPLSQEKKERMIKNTLKLKQLGYCIFLIGLGILIFGCCPLLGFGLLCKLGFISDPNPNPVGFGLLFALAFVPGLIVTGVGAAIYGIAKFKNAGKRI